MLVVNLYAGPGAGKSALAARLFSELKEADINTEYVTEYAKDLVWEGRAAQLSDQLMVTAQQNRRLSRLKGKVAVVITDSPLLLGLNYAPPEYLGSAFAAMVVNLFNEYDNLNIVLERKTKYRELGRVQTEAQALQMDQNIRRMLDSHGMPYHTVPGLFGSVPLIMRLIQDRVGLPFGNRELGGTA